MAHSQFNSPIDAGEQVSVAASHNEPSKAQDVPSESPKPASENRSLQLALGLLFGVIFGFLLQKGGVGKYHILMGMLLLEDFTVVKVMMSAVVVGMIGIYSLHAAGLVKLHIKPTRYGANTLGGILFGIGFALAAYCPGTSAAALGQGNFDAIGVMTGMLVGSYLFAEASGWIARHVNHWGDRGKMTFATLLHVPTRVIVPIVAVLLVLLLATVHFVVDPML